MSNEILNREREIFARKLNFYMQQSNTTQADISSRFGITASTVSDWCKGKKYPRIDKIQMLADYFGILKSELTEDNASDIAERKGKLIPVLGTVAAGVPILATENILDYEEISEEMAKTGEFFALQIKGNSMEPKISEGDVVIVRQQEDVESGQVAIVLVNGDDATCKKFVKHDNGISLVSLNPSYSPMFFTLEEIGEKPIRIIGRVVELRAKL